MNRNSLWGSRLEKNFTTWYDTTRVSVSRSVTRASERISILYLYTPMVQVMATSRIVYFLNAREHPYKKNGTWGPITTGKPWVRYQCQGWVPNKSATPSKMFTFRKLNCTKIHYTEDNGWAKNIILHTLDTLDLFLQNNVLARHYKIYIIVGTVWFRDRHITRNWFCEKMDSVRRLILNRLYDPFFFF